MNITYMIYYDNESTSESTTITVIDYNNLFQILQSIFSYVPGISRIYFESPTMTGTVYHEYS